MGALMVLLPRGLLIDLASWDGNAVPTEGDASLTPFNAMWDGLCELLEHEEFDSSLPQARAEAGALCSLLMSVQWDFFHTGVVLNQPELIPRVEAAAARLDLPATAELMREARRLVPPEILASEDFDVRSAWYDASSEEPDFERLADLSDAVSDGPVWDEAMLAIVRSSRQNPDAFFEPA